MRTPFESKLDIYSEMVFVLFHSSHTHLHTHCERDATYFADVDVSISIFIFIQGKNDEKYTPFVRGAVKGVTIHRWCVC